MKKVCGLMKKGTDKVILTFKKKKTCCTTILFRQGK